MNEFNDDHIPRRKSIKLKYYDYSRERLYYVTLCTNAKVHIFGKIVNEEFYANDVGEMLNKWFLELENKYQTVKCVERQIMPNHLHCIFEFKENGGRTQAHLLRKRARCSPTLFRVLQWFKTMTTNEYIKNVKENGWSRFDKKLWQRTCYEHIIRDEEEFEHAVLYIRRNPERWIKDKYNK